MDDREERVRRRAHKLWMDEGSPKGRENDFLELASELIAIEESEATTLKPVTPEGPYGEPVEPLEPNENLGEFPTLTDEGEQEYPPQSDEGEPPEERGSSGPNSGKR